VVHRDNLIFLLPVLFKLKFMREVNSLLIIFFFLWFKSDFDFDFDFDLNFFVLTDKILKF
jgi:hypothetical protein